MKATNVPAMVLPQPQKKIVFLAGTHRRHSFPWKIVWSETSFYIRPWLADAYQGPSWHLSFHGPLAERKPPGFHVRWDDARKVPEGFGRVFRDLITDQGGRKGWWTGHEVADGVRHAVRIRVPSDIFFVPGPQPWAPGHEDMDLTALNLLAPISRRRASDLDLYVVEPGRQLWWPNEQAGHRDNSIIGPLVNPETGQALTGQVRHHGSASHLTPERLLEPFVGMQDRRVRGITIGEEDGVLWLVEQWGEM